MLLLRGTLVVALLQLLWLVAAVDGWVLPGSFPQEYLEGDPIELRVNKMVSAQTQLPYSFYDLPYCRPLKITESRENLGQILMGDRTENSNFSIQMRRNQECSELCSFQTLSPAHRSKFIKFIDESYFINWTVDNLPVTTKLKLTADDTNDARSSSDTTTTKSDEKDNDQDDAEKKRAEHEEELTTYIAGFPVGWASADGKHHYLYNHASLRLFYNRLVQGKYRIVGFEVQPRSLDHIVSGPQREEEEAGGRGGRMQQTKPVECPEGSSSAPLLEGMPQSSSSSPAAFHPLEIESSPGFAFTYDVTWHPSDVRWASRWDSLLKVKHTEIHWYSIVNCLLTVLCLSGIVGVILLRTLMKDIARYNRLDDLEEAEEESGWKLVHGDVFRKPKGYKFLCILVGTGVQILSMCLITLVLATVGVITPARRGLLLQMLLVLFASSGFFAGYVASKLNRLFDGVHASAILPTMDKVSTTTNNKQTDKQEKDNNKNNKNNRSCLFVVVMLVLAEDHTRVPTNMLRRQLKLWSENWLVEAKLSSQMRGGKVLPTQPTSNKRGERTHIWFVLFS
eukprot:GHVS01107793.1.p1 GENE.GHVS01107793.1~~GHVS01107793.1.p1  ORF type:complete len:581 (+),score=132.43 GHVS01107793.1:49-1743(+)